MEPKINIMKIFHFALWATLFITFWSSCEQSYTPDTFDAQQEIVVEGYIEAGPGANPTYVILTKSIPFLSTIDPNKFSELFVKDAKVTVNDGLNTVELLEFCLDEVPDDLKDEVYAVLGLNPDSSSVNICVYADILGQIKKEPGRKYDLNVTVDGKILTASTTIPKYVELYDFKWTEPPGKPSDTLAELNVKINDPIGVKNYYRYFTATTSDPQLIPPFGSVTDDAIFNGQTFEFPLQRAQRRGGGFNPDAFGLYKRGDSVFVKWCGMDKAHFDFWNTRDFAANSGGPFASYTRISTNINGGLGIWGGYAVNTYRLYCPPK
jgi:hypothetical protein